MAEHAAQYALGQEGQEGSQVPGTSSQDGVFGGQGRQDRTTLLREWLHSTYELAIFPSPQFETIRLSGDIYVDELVIDTYSTTPEPATALLMLLGAAALGHRRRRPAVR